MPTTHTIKINPGCSSDPATLHCYQGDQVCFKNQTSAPVTIVFSTPPGPPIAPPTIGPLSPGGRDCGHVTAAPSTTQYRYHCSGTASLGAGTPGDDGGGIIIVDPPPFPKPDKDKGKGASKSAGAAKKPSKTKAKGKAKPKPKAKPKTKAKPKAKAKRAPKKKARKPARSRK